MTPFPHWEMIDAGQGTQLGDNVPLRLVILTMVIEETRVHL